MGDRFFFYGTLMDGAVRRLVLGPAAQGVPLAPATLEGWRRAAVRGRSYPVVVVHRGASVAGLVTGGLPPAAVARLNRFEGPEYVRRLLSVRTAEGNVAAWVYVARDATLASAADWDFEVWRQRHRERFLRSLAGLAGRMG